ncbi:MAG: sulfotransferase, partial [Sphingomicrobium sp.]
FPRSGTTLLDTFLMGHPAIAVLEEKGLLRSAAQAVEPIIGLPECAPATLVQARATYRALQLRHGVADTQLVVDKAPLNMVLGPLIHCLFGDAPILFAERHPCDAVLSGFMQAFERNVGMASFLDLADAADFYDCAMRVWSASADVIPLQVHRVKYEELIADTEDVLRPVVAFLGLEWDEKLLDHRLTAAARGVILNTSYDQVTEPLHGRAAGRWRRYARHLEPVLPVLLPWAERLGYGAD